jgi:pimeloyl-ACP methyl ester carboxylesterase
MSLTEHERETIIGMSDGGELAQVYTAQRKVITRLKNNPAAVLVEEGTHDGSAWARFTIPVGLVSFRQTKVRRELTEEQRAAAAERLRRGRDSAHQDAAGAA